MLPGALGGIGGWAAAPVTFGVSIITTILGALLGGLFGGPDIGQLTTAVNEGFRSLSKAIDNLKRFSWTVAFALGTLLQTVHDIWIGFLDQLWGFLKQVARAVTRLVTEVLPRVLEWLAKLQKRLDELYAKYVRPILDYIQLIRRYLGILRLFHIKWAAKLDGELLQIEGKIIGPYLAVRRWLGALGQWTSVLVTLKGIIQRPVFVNTMYAYAADWVNLWWVAQSGQLRGRVAPVIAPVTPFASVQEVRTNMLEFVQQGTGKYAAVAERARRAAGQVT